MPARPAGLRNWWRGGGAMEMEMEMRRSRRQERRARAGFSFSGGPGPQQAATASRPRFRRAAAVSRGVWSETEETATLWLLEERHRLMIPLYLAFV